jgi:hypothetical protein
MPQSTIASFPPHPNEAIHLNDWLFVTIHPYLSGRILETESGSGLFASRLTDHGFRIELNANSEDNREFLREKFKSNSLVRAVHRIDFRTDHQLEPHYSHFQDNYPTVLAIGDFVQNDFYPRDSFEKAKSLVCRGGNIIIAGSLPIDVYPGIEADMPEIKKHSRPYILQLLNNFQSRMASYFYWNGLSFVAVGTKI